MSVGLVLVLVKTILVLEVLVRVLVLEVLVLAVLLVVLVLDVLVLVVLVLLHVASRSSSVASKHSLSVLQQSSALAMLSPTLAILVHAL